MQLRLPKPLHGWRQFAGEITIIVVGVLIALGAQSLLEQWQWRQETKISNLAFREELGGASVVAYERLIIQPCLQGRIRELSKLLAEGDGAWKASPMAVRSAYYSNVMPVAYRAPSRLLPIDGWKNAIANGTLSHLPSDRVRELSALYDQIDGFRDLQEEEARAAARLTPLALDGHLNSEGRTNMLGSLAEVDRINALMGLQAGQMLESVRSFHLKYPKPELETIRRRTVKEQRSIRGKCVSSLPLDLN